MKIVLLFNVEKICDTWDNIIFLIKSKNSESEIIENFFSKKFLENLFNKCNS